jgi:hypothetical protein
LPLMGYVYASEFYEYDPSIGPYMMSDQLSMFFVMQGGMVGLIFLFSAYYIWLSMKRIEVPPYSATVSCASVAGLLSILVPGLGQMYNGHWTKGIGYLVGQAGVLGAIFYIISPHADEALGLLLLLFLFPIGIVAASSMDASRNGSDAPPGKNPILWPIRILSAVLLWVESFALRRRVGVIKTAFLVILFGNAVWMTPAAFVGAASSLTDENFATLSLPEDWYFLALMPAKNTAATVMVLIILLSFVLYTGDSSGNDSVGKDRFYLSICVDLPGVQRHLDHGSDGNRSIFPEKIFSRL